MVVFTGIPAWKSLLEKVESENKKILILGDFNIDLIKIDSEPVIADY